MENLQIIQDLAKKFDEVFNEFNISPSMFLSSGNGKNALVHQKLMQTMNGYLTYIMLNSKDFVSLLNENISSSKNIGEGNGLYGLLLVLRVYIRDFMGCFFKVRNGFVEYTNIEDFNLPHTVYGCELDKIDANYKYLEGKMGSRILNPDRQVAMFILPNGKVYYCPLGHFVLANWLCVNGISLKKAIRVEFNQRDLSVDISTLGNGGFAMECNDEYFLELTDEQAQILASIYNTLIEKWKRLKPLEENLKESSGLGVDRTFYSESLAKVNLSKLEQYVYGFSKNKYLRWLASTHKINRFSDESAGE